VAWGLLASTLAFAIVAGSFTAFAFFVVPSRRGWLEIFLYARTLAVTTGIHQVAESSIAILIGQLMGYSALGLFSRATDILKKFDRVVIEVVVPVMLPFLTRRVREGENLKAAYLAKTAHLSAICWPAAGFLMLFADPIVLVLLGDQWVGVIALVRMLAVGVVVMPLCATAWSFVVALRLQRRYLPVVLLVNSLRVSAVVGFSFVSLTMVCLGLVAASAAHAVLIHRLLKPHLDLRMGVIVDAVKASGVTTLLGLAPAVVLSFSLTGSLMHDVLATLCAGVLMVPLWLLGIWRSRHPLKEEIRAALSVARRMGEATP